MLDGVVRIIGKSVSTIDSSVSYAIIDDNCTALPALAARATKSYDKIIIKLFRNCVFDRGEFSSSQRA